MEWTGVVILVALVLCLLGGIVLQIVRFFLAIRSGYVEAERRWRGERNQCLECGYNLRGNTSDVCPECGTDLKRECS